MNKLVEQLTGAINYAISIRPKVGGFPVLAEVLRQAGVEHNIWHLPSCQSVYQMKNGNVVTQGTPLVSGSHEIPQFNKEALIKALRKDQAGEGSFPEFLKSTWEAGVISYDVDTANHKVIYYGARGESYVEDYPRAEIMPNSVS
jgi:uncharacterized protein YbcV (DUF1398 family)